MKKISQIALAAVLTLGVAGGLTVAASPALAQKKEKQAPMRLSKPVQAALGEAQKLLAANNVDGAIAKLNDALAVAKTPDDQYMSNAIMINAAIAKSDNGLLEKALEGALASGKLAATEQPKFWRNIGALALQRGDTTKAAQAFEQVATLDPADSEAIVNLAEVYQRGKNSSQAVATLNRAIAAKKAKGEVAPEAWYRRQLGIAYDAKLANETTASSVALVTAYPSPTNWRDSLVIFRDGAALDDQGSLDVFRLMLAANALAGEKDFFEYAETANLRGYPGEALRAIDAGVAAGALDKKKKIVAELINLVSPKVAGDKASLVSLEKEARASKLGKLASGTADANLGYGNYAKAAELYKLALSKGGVDASVVNTRLGFALAQAGDKAGADAALKSVTTGKRAALAQFYLAWLANKQ